MTHSPIQLQQLSFSFPHKTCFDDFSATLLPGSRIGIIGPNGSGKSSLLQILQGRLAPTEGHLQLPDDMISGYVPQIIEGFLERSGAQRFQAALTQALSLDPNVLLLDEPTNHLDRANRKSLIRLLNAFQGTLLIVSHDPELLRSCVDTLWHIDEGKIQIFSGHYDDYLEKIRVQRNSIEQELSRLNRERKSTHQALMQEQARAKKSDLRGQKSIENRKWPTLVSDEKARRAITTSGKKKRALRSEREELTQALSDLRLPEILRPNFALSASDFGSRMEIAIHHGSLSYRDQAPLIEQLSFSLHTGERLAITGANGSGKSTFIKAILGDKTVLTQGEWHLPKPQDIGYLDQQYATLTPNLSILETLQNACPTWTHPEIRKHLNDFLFRKNEEVYASVSTLSGGEKARLCLAEIAAKTPRVLILDEITNNLDLDTREHVIQVLKDYPGSLIVISHDEDFLVGIGIQETYQIIENQMVRQRLLS